MGEMKGGIMGEMTGEIKGEMKYQSPL